MTDRQPDEGSAKERSLLIDPDDSTKTWVLPAKTRSQVQHDLRTPVNQILGYAQMLQEDATEQHLDPFIADLKKIETAARKLAEVIDKIPQTSVDELNAQYAVARIPVSIPPAPMLSRQPSIEPDPNNILVVDDSDMNREILARRLQQRGYQVITASSGREALDKIVTDPIDLVMLDIMMPELDGIDVLKAIREKRAAADLPVIMATACDSTEDVVRALRLGANDYVAKSLDFSVVLARVETQLSLKRVNDKVRRLNRRLEESQDQIAKLMDSSSLAMHDLSGWARWMADDIARSIGVRLISVWIQDGDQMSLLTGELTGAPSLIEVRAAAQSGRVIVKPDVATIPVRSLSGEFLGALVATGDKAFWDEAEVALIRSFAHQIGSALELKRARHSVAKAAERKKTDFRAMVAKGVQLLRVCPRCARCYDTNSDFCASDGTALDPSFALPFRISNRYRLRRLLGVGGIGAVFEARDERLDRVVAVKVVQLEHSVDVTVRARFEKEARVLARIAHPGVITIYDSGELEDGAHFIIMERLYGSDLEDLLRAKGRGKPAQVARLLRQGAQALAAAHNAGLIHRDLKPGNLFLIADPKGFRTKILDFGLAKEMGRMSIITHVGDVIGTPAFMSPEQMLSKPVDVRSDIYSFAAVAYEALTGRPVAPGVRPLELFEDVVINIPAAVSSLLAGVPSDVDRAFAWALAKAPEDRPDSVEEWVNSFVDLLEFMPCDAAGWPEGADLLCVGAFADPTDAQTTGGDAVALPGDPIAPVVEPNPQRSDAQEPAEEIDPKATQILVSR
jgi:CheY-like chemotaxis protein/predicted Ser/Thr protein kinase